MFGLLLILILFVFGVTLTRETLKNCFKTGKPKFDSKDIIALIFQTIILLFLITFLITFITIFLINVNT
tara:strand:- start:224 stop:430 length:207 start_codon:yes stop_codon:yes gene_type:complete